MTEEPRLKDNELGPPHCTMGCGHKDDKASLASSQISPFSHQPPSSPASKEVWKKGGRMFSILLAVHLALLACTLVSSGAFEKIAVHDYDVFFLLTVMMLIVIVWIIFYLAGTSRCPGAILGKDSHAGPIWLRGRAGAGGEMQGGQVMAALVLQGKQQRSGHSLFLLMDWSMAACPASGQLLVPVLDSLPGVPESTKVLCNTPGSLLLLLQELLAPACQAD